jgi:hypothetical protein
VTLAAPIPRTASLADAGKMGLRYEARSPEAQQLVQGLMEGVVVPAWPEGAQLRPSSLAAAQRALAALVADLLKLETDGRWGACGMSPKDFTSLPFGRDIFTRVRDALEAAGNLTVLPGRQQLTQFTNRHTGQPGPVHSGGGWVSRFQLTPAALEGVRTAGVDVGAWGTHWGRAAITKASKASTAPLLVLRSRAERVYGTRSPGADMMVDVNDPKAAAILQDLQEHNAFLAAADIGGVAFPGLRRMFHDGDRTGFAWQRGGRFYSLPGGERYEALSGEDRREAITIGGLRVGEADIRASHLSFLYALRGLPFDPGASDPYALAGLHRDLAKLWVAQAIGRDNATARRWAPKAQQRYEEIAPGRRLADDHPIAIVGAAVLAVHPVLGALGRPDVPSFLDLQFHESEVLREAMAQLRRKGIGSLPVHDSLIVPAGELQEASKTMKEAFSSHIESLTGKPCSVKLAVQIKGDEGLAA